MRFLALSAIPSLVSHVTGEKHSGYESRGRFINKHIKGATYHREELPHHGDDHSWVLTEDDLKPKGDNDIPDAEDDDLQVYYNDHRFNGRPNQPAGDDDLVDDDDVYYSEDDEEFVRDAGFSVQPRQSEEKDDDGRVAQNMGDSGDLNDDDYDYFSKDDEGVDDDDEYFDKSLNDDDTIST